MSLASTRPSRCRALSAHPPVPQRTASGKEATFHHWQSNPAKTL